MHELLATGVEHQTLLLYDHADDAEVWRHRLQCQRGDDVFVNPVTESCQHEWSACLLQGNWVDIWTGENLRGLKRKPGAWPSIRSHLLLWAAWRTIEDVLGAAA